MTNAEFQDQVITDLAELKAQMHTLLGNGQPGRVSNLEVRVEQHSTVINRIIGGLVVINTLLGISIAVAKHF